MLYVRRGAALLLYLLFLAGALYAQDITIPPLTGRVVDAANILSESTEQTLERMLGAHEDSTSNQVVVLTVPSLQGLSVEAFAFRVAETWKLGQADRDNGVLVLIAPNERKVRIEVGMGLEDRLPDVLAGRIIREEMIPAFREGDYDTGVLRGVTAILSALEGSYTPVERTRSERPPVLFGLLFLLFTFFPGLMAMLSSGCMRFFMFVFLLPFVAFSLWTLIGKVWVGVVLYVVAFWLLAWYLERSPRWQRLRKKWKEAQKKGGTVTIWGITFSPGSGGSGWGRGGGFSGGGGSFGGGGASGSW